METDGRNVSRENFIRKLPEIFHSRISRASLPRKIILEIDKKKKKTPILLAEIIYTLKIYSKGKDRSKRKNKVIFSDDL